jgi:hypothetical protein
MTAADIGRELGRLAKTGTSLQPPPSEQVVYIRSTATGLVSGVDFAEAAKLITDGESEIASEAKIAAWWGLDVDDIDIKEAVHATTTN